MFDEQKKQINKVELHRYICEEINKLYERKNHDYGDSFHQTFVEEVLCIRYHMGAFVSKEEWQDYTRAVNKYPNVLWTHTADMLASHVAGI